ncbi:MAG: class I SAM-dependent methyltransferase [Chloroflexota bacterium]
MKTFDERARGWDSDPAHVERAVTVAGDLREAIPLSTTMNALEYGCGTGLLSFALRTELGSITLADTSQGMLDVLKEKIVSAGLTNMSPLRLDLVTDPLPSERYDVIYSLMTLHHIPNYKKVLHGFYHLLKPGGYLCVADLDAEDGTFHSEGFDGHNGFDRALLKKHVETIGFMNVQFSETYTVHKTINSADKAFPMFLMSAEKS